MSESKKQRSYSGCVRCKRRRQKCNELKPACGRCSMAGVGCEYGVRLRWGGRKFERSRFGGLQGVEKIERYTEGFIYTTAAKEISRSKFESVSLSLDPQPFPSLSVTERFLLNHFTREASRITCCHVNVQKELCQLVISMGVEVPCLLYATLAWAAIHCVALGRTVEGIDNPPRLVTRFKAKSVECLRMAIQNSGEGGGKDADALLATVRTLCQCEIHSGTDGNSVWRIHVKGAKALMAAIRHSNSSRCPRSRLLCRWYASLESLATLTPSSVSTDREETSLSELLPEIVYLDDYNGYSTDLSFILGKIGSLADSLSLDSSARTRLRLREKADEMEDAVYAIMERDNGKTPQFYPGVAERLSQDDIKQYSLCNESYQHTALIHVNTQLRCLPSNSAAIQQSVKRIIKCASSMAPAYGLSPIIVMATPLFTAGCEALGEDRAAIRNLLERLFEALKIRNIKLGIEILEDHWAGGESRDWKDFLRRKKWDFIPY